jgi:hypothetical protein
VVKRRPESRSDIESGEDPYERRPASLGASSDGARPAARCWRCGAPLAEIHSTDESEAAVYRRDRQLVVNPRWRPSLPEPYRYVVFPERVVPNGRGVWCRLATADYQVRGAGCDRARMTPTRYPAPVKCSRCRTLQWLDVEVLDVRLVPTREELGRYIDRLRG